MDNALEVITVEAIAPGAGGGNGLAVSDNSLTIRDADSAKLIAMWGQRHTDGFFRLTSPLLHDNIVGLGYEVPSDDIPMSWMSFPQTLTPQDTLTATLSGDAGAGNIEANSFLVMYENLAGIDGKLITADTLMKQGAELYASQNILTLLGTGGYTGSELLNADQDQLKANMDYAIIGFSKVGDDQTSTVRYRSPDWGNLGVGGPTFNAAGVSRSSNFFLELSKQMNMPLIPVFNASQKSSVFIDAVTDENGGTVTIMTHMVRLKSGTFGKKRR